MNEKDLKAIKRILRENRIEQEKIYGRKRSKIWDNKLTNKEKRHLSKTELKKMIKNKEFDV